MKEIVINSRPHGKHVVMIDDDDFDKVSKHKWRIEKGRTSYYAITSIWRADIRKITTLRLHQLIIGVLPCIGNGKRANAVDHINHNGLDNRKENLRICHDNKGNSANSRVYRRSSTGLKGVCFKKEKKLRPFVSRIRVDNRSIHLGCFDDKYEAAKAYNNAAVKYFGEFACLNEI